MTTQTGAAQLQIERDIRRRYVKALRRVVSSSAYSVRAVSKLYNWQHHIVRPRLCACLRDGPNRLRYGPDAPVFAERLWIDPLRVPYYSETGTPWESGLVELEDWPKGVPQPIEEDPVLNICSARWIAGVRWEETGEMQRMERVIKKKGSSDGCRTRADILRRCAQLDELFHMIRKEGRLRTRAEVRTDAFREFGGIVVDIGPQGVLIRENHGRHRFAMARILRIPLIPVRVGVVHHSALPFLPRLRQSPRDR